MYKRQQLCRVALAAPLSAPHPAVRRSHASQNRNTRTPAPARGGHGAAAHARAVVTVFHFIAYSLAGLAFGFAVFVNVYVMIALDDLQSDFVNPHDATRRINRLIAWEIGAHACGCAFMLVGGHWVMVLANAPLVYYHYIGCARLWDSFFIHSFRSLSP